MATVSLFLLALAMLYVGEAQESHLICKQISQVFQSQRRIVDYEIINSKIDEKLNPVINKQAIEGKKTANLEETIEALQSSLSALQEKYEVISRNQGSVPFTPIRLIGGSGDHEGRVEVQHLGEWGTVCDDNWDLPDAHVICRRLGFKNATAAPGGAHFGRGTDKILLDDVVCEGDEEKIEQCRFQPWGINNCRHGEDASVICIPN